MKKQINFKKETLKGDFALRHAGTLIVVYLFFHSGTRKLVLIKRNPRQRIFFYFTLFF